MFIYVLTNNIMLFTMKSKDIGGVFMKEQQTHFLQLLQAVVNLNKKCSNWRKTLKVKQELVTA